MRGGGGVRKLFTRSAVVVNSAGCGTPGGSLATSSAIGDTGCGAGTDGCGWARQQAAVAEVLTGQHGSQWLAGIFAMAWLLVGAQIA